MSIFFTSKSMYHDKRVVLSSHADVARDANDVDTCLTRPSTAMRARARAASQFHAPPRAFTGRCRAAILRQRARSKRPNHVRHRLRRLRQ